MSRSHQFGLGFSITKIGYFSKRLCRVREILLKNRITESGSRDWTKVAFRAHRGEVACSKQSRVRACAVQVHNHKHAHATAEQEGSKEGRKKKGFFFLILDRVRGPAHLRAQRPPRRHEVRDYVLWICEIVLLVCIELSSILVHKL